MVENVLYVYIERVETMLLSPPADEWGFHKFIADRLKSAFANDYHFATDITNHFVDSHTGTSLRFVGENNLFRHTNQIIDPVPVSFLLGSELLPFVSTIENPVPATGWPTPPRQRARARDAIARAERILCRSSDGRPLLRAFDWEILLQMVGRSLRAFNRSLTK
ncbi:hypothetical protein BJX70DRAFT_28863 [Aspergillus crustosus]